MNQGNHRCDGFRSIDALFPSRWDQGYSGGHEQVSRDVDTEDQQAGPVSLDPAAEPARADVPAGSTKVAKKLLFARDSRSAWYR